MTGELVLDARRTEALRFEAGEVGFVFYEVSRDGSFVGLDRSRTYAFGTIADAAAWLVRRFPDAQVAPPVPQPTD